MIGENTERFGCVRYRQRINISKYLTLQLGEDDRCSLYDKEKRVSRFRPMILFTHPLTNSDIASKSKQAISRFCVFSHLARCVYLKCNSNVIIHIFINIMILCLFRSTFFLFNVLNIFFCCNLKFINWWLSINWVLLSDYEYDRIVVNTLNVKMRNKEENVAQQDNSRNSYLNRPV